MMDSDHPFSMIDLRTANLQLTFSLLLAAGFIAAAIFGL